MRIKKLLLAAALLGFAMGSNASRPAFAVNPCEALNGTSCPAPNTTISCVLIDGFPSSCKCMFNRTWVCYL